MTGVAPGTGAQVPLVLALDDPDAVPGVVGGKGASLGRLARAGVRGPPGFHVTTATYLDFLDGGLREELLAGLSLVDVADTSTFGAAAGRIGELFAGRPVRSSTAAAIAGAYASLGDGDVPVAVRSSATVEDLAGLSAAGQHDTYLNVRGEAAVVDAVRRCWASVWSARAISYRAGRGIAPDDVSIAVVVQRLVPAEAAGVMFTIDPVSGAPDQIVVSANWGLGESVAAGDVSPDVAVVDRASGTLVSYQPGDKQVMTMADGEGTRMGGGPEGGRVEIDSGELRLRMADFKVDVPRASVRGVARSSFQTKGTIGVHSKGGRWLANGSADSLVEITIDPPVYTRRSLSSLFLRMKVNALIVSLVDPDGFIIAMER